MAKSARKKPAGHRSRSGAPSSRSAGNRAKTRSLHDGSRPEPAAAPGPKPTPGKPVLLSGGNPQIPKGDGDAPVRAYIAAMPGWKQDVGRRLDDLIVSTVPGVRKAVRWNTPFYGLEGQGWFIAFHCITRYIKISFFRGTSLTPIPPVGSKQPEVRYLHIHEGEWNADFDEHRLTSWIRQAAALPGEGCF